MSWIHVGFIMHSFSSSQANHRRIITCFHHTWRILDSLMVIYLKNSSWYQRFLRTWLALKASDVIKEGFSGHRFWLHHCFLRLDQSLGKMTLFQTGSGNESLHFTLITVTQTVDLILVLVFHEDRARDKGNNSIGSRLNRMEDKVRLTHHLKVTLTLPQSSDVCFLSCHI